MKLTLDSVICPGCAERLPKRNRGCPHCGYPKLCIAILKELRGLGYVCAVRAEERQFVDLWLEVKWGDKP